MMRHFARLQDHSLMIMFWEFTCSTSMCCCHWLSLKALHSKARQGEYKALVIQHLQLLYFSNYAMPLGLASFKIFIFLASVFCVRYWICWIVWLNYLWFLCLWFVRYQFFLCDKSYFFLFLSDVKDKTEL